ncbi:MAG: UDP-glucose 6-dehydrogenase, partial [Chitinophagaceae bacterium]|nr:UDP-glucose 6-dehydrogenase [Chitinophagaceae bacterium]
KIGIWGLSFKPNTDDIREAPALYIIPKLVEAGAIVSCYDPEGMPNTKMFFEKNHPMLLSKINFVSDDYEVLKDADALAICTEWSIFRTPDFERMKSLMKEKVIFDGRNLFDLEQIREAGFYYNSIGRKTIL